MSPIDPSRDDRVAKILRDIVTRRRERLVAEAGTARLVSPDAGRAEPLGPAENRFLEALAAFRGRERRGHRAVIAEVKLGSPRIGSLAARVDPEAQARLYADGGAAALSVVVEPDFFHGSYELLARCREASGLPAIAKDFVVHPVQLERARDAGASAVLLVAALYDRDGLLAHARAARALGLVPLVETHDRRDLALLGVGDARDEWELVGVNNRDLRTFEVDLDHSAALVPELPAAAFKVAESGIGSGADAARLHRAGFDAFLVGESLLLADDPAAQLADLVEGTTP
jgi:indole-3-glycerol phosphate synthase